MLPPPSRRTLALAARGALAGAIGGAGAGALDFLFALPHVSTFLPTGKGRLLLFLCVLYGAAAALAGALAGLLAAALGWATDLGPLWRRAFDESELDSPRAPDGARYSAYAVALLLVGATLGQAVCWVAADSLQRYHHRGLIAALVGATAAGLALAGAPLVFLIAAALSPLLRVGPRARAELRLLVGWAAPAWTLGLVTGGGAVALLLGEYQKRPRMPPAFKAINVGLWSPILLLLSLVAWHLMARRLSKRWRPRAVRTLTGAAVGVAIAIALPLALAIGLGWSTVRQLDHRPFVALALMLAFMLLAALRDPLGRIRPAFAGLALALPAFLCIATFQLGRSDRVRKAAVSQSGLAAPLVRALQTALDFDRDGYSPVLGGGDCDDFDSRVHPGAFDWPDDGIDQDCNGHQATLLPPAPRPFAPVPASVPTTLNVVLLTLDALRADHVGSYGYSRPTTPHLDALARESVRFASGWAHAPSTRYSVPAILIGRYPSTIAVGNAWWPPNVLPDNRLIAEILHDRGYRTAAFLSYYYFDRRWGLDQGFDDYDIHLQTLHSMGGDPSATRGSSARQLADLNVDYIEKHQNETFFLWSHYYDTHFMFEPHPDLPASNFGPSEIDLYDGEIRFTDEQIGRVLDALKRAGLWEKTLLIVTSDHGDGFGEHGLPPSQRHGYHLYRNETKVPILIRIPGVAPRVVDEPVGHIDLVPTVLNALRAAPDAEPQLLGESLLGLMLGQPPPTPRRVFQEVWYEGPTSRKAVATRDWHLIRNLVPDDTVELYDLRSDPAEDRDRAGDGAVAEPERELADALSAWMDQSALPVNFKKRIQGNVSRTPLAAPIALGDRLGDWLTLAGVEVVTPRVAPGDAAEVALVFRGDAAVPEGWHLFTHFVGASGRRLNADHEPVEGVFPLARVRAGVWLRDRVRMQLPADWPPGPLTVEVGLWRRGERAPVHGSHQVEAGAVRAATLAVAPSAGLAQPLATDGKPR